ncbi:DNA gyrase subunit B [Paenibacillus sp. UNCCL117]|uniref:ATP-binding protein n=1 Tax=unclassified Paenibacillus TaxID=185978 RepID=UPI00088C5FEA|nr:MULTISPECIES: ATP-binding protein [unclassified Paenibacillus]SDC55502.1 DNA gyrase subunit B [Paenibacillus sp. cl123]SFW10924.1 DNA gyrase subunit B [Paenibacillus sp. UNCCL117]
MKTQMTELERLVRNISTGRPSFELPDEIHATNERNSSGYVYYAGQYQSNGKLLRWEPKERQLEQLLSIGTEKISKILSALGSKPRLDIITSILIESLTGTEIVEKLGLGTTGQLYHHLKALQGADLLSQDKSGRYTLPDHRKLPFLLLLSAVVDMLDTSDYLDMVEVRNSAGSYLGKTSKDGFDANLLLWAVVENSILEHVAGYVNEVHIFLHQNGGVTVSDNGRGIPVKAFQDSNKSTVQTVLTDIERFSSEAPYQAPGAEKGISIAIVNALTYSLTVEVKREGYIYRQDYKHGIPQSDLMTVGVSQSNGTRITFRPDPEIFGKGFARDSLNQQLERLALSYPNLTVYLH